MWSPAFIVSIFAIVSVFISRIFMKRIKNFDIKPEDLENTIFVVCISYKDPKWIRSISDIFSKAKKSGRIFVGVVEYVEDAKDSVANEVPWNLRTQIRVHTVSHKKSSTLRNARELCITKLFHHEKYTLFIRSVNLCNDWDNVLIHQLSKTSYGLISTSLSKDTKACFPCIQGIEDKKLVVQYASMKMHSSNPVHSILYSNDLCFCLSNIHSILYSHNSELEISAYLSLKNIEIFCPTTCVGIRTSHPYGIKQKPNTVDDTGPVFAYCDKIGVDVKNNVISANAKCGLTANPSSSELIFKYGSISEARVIIQQYE